MMKYISSILCESVYGSDGFYSVDAQYIHWIATNVTTNQLVEDGEAMHCVRCLIVAIEII